MTSSERQDWEYRAGSVPKRLFISERVICDGTNVGEMNRARKRWLTIAHLFCFATPRERISSLLFKQRE